MRNERFLRSRIRVHLLTERRRGVVSVDVTLFRGNPEGVAGSAWRPTSSTRPELLCPSPCEISIYMGAVAWIEEPEYADMDRSTVLPDLVGGKTLAHEIVHIVGRPWGEGQCTHPPSFDFDYDVSPYRNESGRFTDHVRQNCFEGIPPWVIPAEYW